MIWSSSFKQFFMGLGVACLMISFGIYLLDPNDRGITPSSGEFSQSEAALIMAVMGLLLIFIYYIGAWVLKSNYREENSRDRSGDNWCVKTLHVRLRSATAWLEGFSRRVLCAEPQPLNTAFNMHITPSL